MQRPAWSKKRRLASRKILPGENRVEPAEGNRKIQNLGMHIIPLTTTAGSSRSDRVLRVRPNDGQRESSARPEFKIQCTKFKETSKSRTQVCSRAMADEAFDRENR
jgi:hypothetical protein